jgi:hypothetical protein
VVPEVEAARAVDRIPEIVLRERGERFLKHVRMQPAAEDQAGAVHADLHGGVAEPPGELQFFFAALPASDR